MEQKKKRRITRVAFFTILLAIMLSIYYCIAPDDFKHQIQTIYTSVTEIEEKTSGERGALEVYYFDVGQADCTLLLCDGQTMLIDAGNNADGKWIVAQLKEMGITKIDYLVGTHPHEDHIGGLDNIIKNMKVGKIFMTNRPADSMTFEEILDAAMEKNLKVTTPKIGKTFSLGTATFEIISAKVDAEDTNDASIVIKVTFGEHQFLFTGDCTSNLEETIQWNDIDVLKVAHHGSRYSTSQDFLEKTKPEIAIISAGVNNDYGHPHKETIKRLQKMGCQIYRTDQKGTVYVKSTGNKITVKLLDICLDGNRK